MAKIFPKTSDFFNYSWGEKAVYEALKQLDDDYVVFYSVPWQNRNKKGEVVWGESDFTIFHPDRGILVIEVKSGKISSREGKFYQTSMNADDEHEINDPLAQAGKSKYKFRELIREKLSRDERILVEAIVWFPSIDFSYNRVNDLPPSYDRRIILDENALNDVEYYIKQAYDYYRADEYTSIKDGSILKIINALAPEFDLVPSFSSIKKEAEYSFLRLTNEQALILDYITEQRKATVQGGAGTGKTLLAIEQAKRLSSEGKTLFLCFNKMLYNYLKNNYNIENVDFYNIHSFLQRYSNDIEVINEEKDFISILDKINIDSLEYSNFIIDEAQDFYGSVIDYFSNVSDIKNGKFYVFYDKNQLLYYKDGLKWLDKSECRLVLNKICRNTKEIAITAGSPLDLEIKKYDNLAKGEIPTLNIVESKDKVINTINRIIRKLKKNGFNNNEIVILSLTTEEKSILNGVKNINGNNIVNYPNNQDILFTTSKKFKGLESEAIIIIDFDDKVLEDNFKKRNFYVASSRAKQRLDIVCVSENESLKNLANKIYNLDIDDDLGKITYKFKVSVNEDN